MVTATTKAAILRHFHPRLCLIGAPGSGKGSYGKILASHWNIPLVSVSQVLSQRSCQTIQTASSGGKLVDDEVVSQALVDYLSTEQQQQQQQQQHKGFILDGFPRTIQQVHMMQNSWPQDLQLQAAVHLNVPVEVCERKLLGRRICTRCGHHYNIHHVLSGGFDLPAKLPRPGECHKPMVQFPQQHQLHRCNAEHWTTRDDDQPHIIHHRLEVYTEHTQPILEYFEKAQTLFQFTPYKGFQDMPQFQSELEQWLVDHFPETVTTTTDDDS